MKLLAKPSFILQLLSSLFLLAWMGCSKKTDPTIKQPVLGSVTISEVKTTSAKATCTIKDVGFGVTGSSTISQYGICYATKENPTITDAKISLGTSATATLDMVATLPGLSPATDYYVRGYVVSDNGTVYSDQIKFTTDNQKAPEVTTADATDLTATTFSMTGKLTSLGTSDITQFGHVLSATNQTPTTADTKTEMGAANAVPKDFKSVFGSLKPNTTYYVRAYATNGTGTGYSEVKTVKTTDVPLPVVTKPTNPSGLVGVTTLSLYFDVTYTGSIPITEVGLCYSTTNQTPVVDDGKTKADRAGTGSFQGLTINNLQPNTTYYVRAYALTGAGVGYSPVNTLKTSTITPPVISVVKRESELVCSSSNSLLSNVAFYDNPCTGSTPGNAEVKVSFTYESKTETAAKFGICLRPENQSGDPVIDDAKIESGNTYSSLLGGYFSARLNVLDKTGTTKTVNCGACSGGLLPPPCGNQKATEYIYRNPFALQYTVFLVGGGSKKGTSYKYRAYIVMTNGNVYYGPTTTIDAVTVCNGPG